MNRRDDRQSTNHDVADAEPVTLRGPARRVMLAVGFVFVGLGAAGTILPLVPTTPFLLVAAACFARSSPRFYRWLLSRPGVGPMVRDWRTSHIIPLRAKVWAVSLIVVVGGSSVVIFVGNLWARLVMGAGLLAVIVWLLRQPSAPKTHRSD